MFTSAFFQSAEEARAFEKGLELQLRAGDADIVLDKLREMLVPLAAQSSPIARIALATSPDQLKISNWSDISRKIAALETKDRPLITALGVDLSWPGHVGLEPDENGCLEPHVETNYYSDKAFPFSTSTREDLLRDGYSAYGTEWQGCFEDIDGTLSIKGLERLYGAAYATRNYERGAAIEKLGSAAEQDGARLAAIFAAVLFHVAIREMIRNARLPRPLTVVVGSNEDYPFFNAPVFSQDELTRAASTVPLQAEPPERKEVPPTGSSTATATAHDHASHPSGSSLRRSLAGAAAEELAKDSSPVERSGLLARLFPSRARD